MADETGLSRAGGGGRTEEGLVEVAVEEVAVEGGGGTLVSSLNSEVEGWVCSDMCAESATFLDPLF